MWRILNKIFGWDYVVWSTMFGNGIAKIHTDESGQIYIWICKVNKDCHIINDLEDVKLWLTCHPNKYL